MFQLQVSNPDVTNGTIAVSWCLDHELIKELADRGIAEPYVVIVVAPVDKYKMRKEYRKVIPLRDLMTYVEFRCSGPNKIWGFISYSDKKETINTYMSKADGEFKTWVLDSDGSQYIVSSISGGRSTPLECDVPEGVFAPEPMEWEKEWVNFFHRDKVVDQCEFRRRRMFAYTLQVLIMLAFQIIKTVQTLFAALTVQRSFSLKYWLHPLTYNFVDAMDMFEKGSYLIFKLNIDTYSKYLTVPQFIRKYWLLPTMPLISIPLLLLLAFGKFKMLTAILSGCVIAVGIIVCVLLLCNNAHFLGTAFEKVFEWIFCLFNKPGKEKVKPTYWYMNANEMELITCSPERKPLSFKKLPAKHKTVKLYFQDIKSKVCKPFSL